MIPHEPPHPTMVAYRQAFEAALWGNPDRAARLAELEAACRAAKSEAEYRVSGVKIAALVREVEDELAPDWPQVWYGTKGQPPGSGHF